MLPSKWRFIPFYIFGFLLLIQNSNAIFIDDSKVLTLNSLHELDEAINQKWNNNLQPKTEWLFNGDNSISMNIIQQNQGVSKASRQPRAGAINSISFRDRTSQLRASEIYGYYLKVAFVILGFSFGVALDMENVKVVLKRPIGHVISLFCVYIFSPVVSAFL